MDYSKANCANSNIAVQSETIEIQISKTQIYFLTKQIFPFLLTAKLLVHS